MKAKFLRDAVLIICSSTISSNVFAQEAIEEPAKKPNVIIILVDDMGYGGLSCFDNKNYQTPEIDRLAADGLKMTDFHSNGSVCSPTRAAMMTGRYQQRSGLAEVVRADPKAASHQLGIHDKEWTFPEALKQAGYTSAIFGKWHLGYKPKYNPIKHGFDEFIGFVSGNIDAYSHRDQESVKDWWHGEKLTPFQARASKIERGPRKGTIHESAPEETYSNNPEDEDFLMRHFVLPVDQGVGMIRKKVEELGIADNTMIWFISDNGADRHNHTMSSLTRNSKGSFYEGGHRVPAILWAPSKVKAGSTSDELMLTFDLMPTTLKLAGVDTPEGFKFDGEDIAPAIFNGETLVERPVLWNRRTNGALRLGDFKLVVHGKNGADELFDMSKDPQEQNDIVMQNTDKAKELKEIYDKLLAETRKDSPYTNSSSKKKSKEKKGSNKLK